MSLKRSSTTQPGNMTFSRGGPDEQQAEAVHHQHGGRNPAQAEAVRRLLDGRQADGGRHFQEDERRPPNSPRTDLVFPWDSQPQARVEREPVDQARVERHQLQQQRAETVRRLLDGRLAGRTSQRTSPSTWAALGKVQRVGTGLTQTVPPQAPMRGLSALNGELKELRSQAQAPDELLH